MSQLQFRKIINTYRDMGIVKAKELILPLAIALNFLDELEKIGVVVLGLDGWIYHEDGSALQQDESVDYYVGDDVLSSHNKSDLSIKRVRDYLLNKQLPDTSLVSFTLDVPMNWIDELF